MKQTIMAFDPGYTTGVAFYVSKVQVYEVQGLTDLWDTLHMGGPTRVVYESFLYQRRDKVDLRPVEGIGVIRLYCQLNGIIPVAQTPATGKRFWTDKKIKQLDLWKPGLPHAMDALRHLLYYMSFGLKDHRWIEQLQND
jgi:hypothetical protein